MKLLNAILCASALLFAALPAMALDPHDAQVTSLTAALNLNNSASTATTYANVAGFTLTTHAVNSGTNSYLIDAWVTFAEGSQAANAVTVDLTTTVSSVTTEVPNTAISFGGSKTVHFIAEVESLAVGNVVNLRVKFANVASGSNVNTLAVQAGVLRIVGLAGATQ